MKTSVAATPAAVRIKSIGFVILGFCSSIEVRMLLKKFPFALRKSIPRSTFGCGVGGVIGLGVTASGVWTVMCKHVLKNILIIVLLTPSNCGLVNLPRRPVDSSADRSVLYSTANGPSNVFENPSPQKIVLLIAAIRSELPKRFQLATKTAIGS
jgi:hypothetical protein